MRLQAARCSALLHISAPRVVAAALHHNAEASGTAAAQRTRAARSELQDVVYRRAYSKKCVSWGDQRLERLRPLFQRDNLLRQQIMNSGPCTVQRTAACAGQGVRAGQLSGPFRLASASGIIRHTVAGPANRFTPVRVDTNTILAPALSEARLLRALLLLEHNAGQLCSK